MFDVSSLSCQVPVSEYTRALSLRIVAASLLVTLGFACGRSSEDSEPAVFGNGSDTGICATDASVLDGMVTEYMSRHRIPGLAVGIVLNGRPAYAKGFGVADPKTGRRVTEQTLFHTASVSKMFVATAILQLVEQGKVVLDQPANTYLPYFELADERAASITLRQMLSHTSGMPDIRDYGWTNPEFDEAALERYVRSLSNHRLMYDPGARFSYSNMAYEVLGDLIAKVSGQSFEEYMHQSVLIPGGLENSTFSRSEVGSSEGAIPFVGRTRPIESDIYPYHRAHAPSSTLHSSVVDLSNWIVANVNRGEYGDTRILAETSYEVLWSPHAGPRPDRQMGLGWMLGESPYGLWAFHGGRDVGFRSHLSVFPNIQAGIVILSNWSDAPIAELRNALVRVAFECDFDGTAR